VELADSDEGEEEGGQPSKAPRNGVPKKAKSLGIYARKGEAN
jgi:hypothetical protein